MVQSIPDELIEQAAARFRMLGDPTRLAVVRALMAGGELNVGRLVADTGRSQSNVSKHLKRMTRAGLLGRRKDGLQVFYRLADPQVERVCRLMCEVVTAAQPSGNGRPAGPASRRPRSVET